MRDSEGRRANKDGEIFFLPARVCSEIWRIFTFYPARPREIAQLTSLVFSLGKSIKRENLGNLTYYCLSSSEPLLFLPQSDAPALQAIHGRELPLHRRPEPHQLQHALRAEDAHDYLSRNGATRFHGHALDHCKLDAPTM